MWRVKMLDSKSPQQSEQAEQFENNLKQGVQQELHVIEDKNEAMMQVISGLRAEQAGKGVAGRAHEVTNLRQQLTAQASATQLTIRGSAEVVQDDVTRLWVGK